MYLQTTTTIPPLATAIGLNINHYSDDLSVCVPENALKPRRPTKPTADQTCTTTKRVQKRK